MKFIAHGNSKAVYKQASNSGSPDYSHFHTNVWYSNVSRMVAVGPMVNLDIDDVMNHMVDLEPYE